MGRYRIWFMDLLHGGKIMPYHSGKKKKKKKGGKKKKGMRHHGC